MSAPGHHDDSAVFVALAGAAGYVDVLAYLGLGKAFVANMTGNTVLLALAVGQQHWQQVYRHGAALTGFAVGVLAAGVTLARRSDHTARWSDRGMLMAITGWLAVAAAAWWLTTGLHTRAYVHLPLVAAFAAAMGAQATVAYLGARPGVPVTFDTGLLITLLGSVAGADRDRLIRLHVGVIAGLAIGALAGALAMRFATAPAAIGAALLVGVAASVRRTSPSRA